MEGAENDNASSVNLGRLNFCVQTLTMKKKPWQFFFCFPERKASYKGYREILFFFLCIEVNYHVADVTNVKKKN